MCYFDIGMQIDRYREDCYDSNNLEAVVVQFSPIVLR